MVFRRVHLRFSCSSAAVNGLTTNRLDLHRITNAFTTNLSVCDRSSSSPSLRRDISVYLSFSSSRGSLLSSPLARARQFPPRLVVLGRVVDWKSAIPVRGDRLRQRLFDVNSLMGYRSPTIRNFEGESVHLLFGPLERCEWFLKFNFLRTRIGTILICRNGSRFSWYENMKK